MEPLVGRNYIISISLEHGEQAWGSVTHVTVLALVSLIAIFPAILVLL